MDTFKSGTNVAIGCTSYRWWCTLPRVSTCTTINMCTKQKKQCSKENSDAKNKKHMNKMVLPLHMGGLPKHAKIQQFLPPIPACSESVDISAP